MSNIRTFIVELINCKATFYCIIILTKRIVTLIIIYNDVTVEQKNQAYKNVKNIFAFRVFQNGVILQSSNYIL
jgi:hypothetical protein